MAKSIKGSYITDMENQQLSEAKAQETLQLMLSKNTELRNKDAAKAQKKKSIYLRYVPAFAALAACVVLAVALIRPGQNTNIEAGKRFEYGSVQLSALPSGLVSRGEAGDDFEAAFGVASNDLFQGWTITDTIVYSSGEHKQAFVELTRGEASMYASVSDMENALYGALEDKNAGPSGARFNLDPSTNELSAVYRRSELWIVLTSEGIEKTEFETIVSELSK